MAREYDWAYRPPVRTDWIEPIDPREPFINQEHFDGDAEEQASGTEQAA